MEIGSCEYLRVEPPCLKAEGMAANPTRGLVKSDQPGPDRNFHIAIPGHPVSQASFFPHQCRLGVDEVLTRRTCCVNIRSLNSSIRSRYPQTFSKEEYVFSLSTSSFRNRSQFLSITSDDSVQCRRD